MLFLGSSVPITTLLLLCLSSQFSALPAQISTLLFLSTSKQLYTLAYQVYTFLFRSFRCPCISVQCQSIATPTPASPFRCYLLLFVAIPFLRYSVRSFAFAVLSVSSLSRRRSVPCDAFAKLLDALLRHSLFDYLIVKLALAAISPLSVAFKSSIIKPFL